MGCLELQEPAATYTEKQRIEELGRRFDALRCASVYEVKFTLSFDSFTPTGEVFKERTLHFLSAQYDIRKIAEGFVLMMKNSKFTYEQNGELFDCKVADVQDRKSVV